MIMFCEFANFDIPLIEVSWRCGDVVLICGLLV